MTARVPFIYRIIPFLIVVVCIINYTPGLTGEFVWDDVTYFVYNDLLTELSPFDLKFIFTQPSNYWGEMLPLRDFLYIIQYQLFGDWTVGYHIFSLLLFIGSGLVLFQWVKELTLDYFVAAADIKQEKILPIVYGSIVMALFFASPVYVETVAYISGQKDILSVLFILLSLLFLYRVGKTTSNKTWLLLLIGVLFHYLAILSKLSALSTILFVPVLWLITGKRKPKQTIKLIGFWVAANVPVVFWFVHTSRLYTPFELSNVNTDIFNRIPRAFNLLGTHIEHIVWPWFISFGYPFDNEWSFNLSFVIGLIALIIALIVIIKKRNSFESLGLLIFGIYLLPVLQVFPEMPNSKIYDRYLAIPIIGIFIIIISLVNKTTGAWRKRIVVVAGFLIILFGSWLIITIKYIPTFNSSVASTEYLYKLYPNWRTTPFNLTYALINDGQLDRAERMVKSEKSFEYPNWVKDYFMGRILQGRGDLDQAYNYLYSASVKTNRGGFFPFADFHIAEIMVKKKDYRTAKLILESILTHKMKNPVITCQAKKLASEIDLILLGEFRIVE